MRKFAMATAVVLMTSAAAHADIKIGAVLSVTGPASFLGEPEKKTLEMYIRDINSRGGVLGQQLSAIIYDDGGDASKARTFATRLVEEDKVDAVLGGSATGPALAMAPVFEEAGVPSLRLPARRRLSFLCASGCSRRRTPNRCPAGRSSRI
jgi:branched-chain amino acid transport system substrate-binding protein